MTTKTDQKQRKAHSETPIPETASVDRVGTPNSVKDRQARRQTLMQVGFSIEQIDGGQPKVDYYRHAPRLKPNGQIFKSHDGESDGEIGKLIPNQPGDQFTAVRLSGRGVLPWPPSETCECKYCLERNGTERTDRAFMRPEDIHELASPSPVTFTENDVTITGEAESTTIVRSYPSEGGIPEIVANPTDPRAAMKEKGRCPDCDFVVRRGKKIENSLRAHRSHKHK